MDRFAVFVAAITPGLLVLAYGIAKTRASWKNDAVATAFLLGGVGAVAAVPLELVLEKLLGLVVLTPLLKAAITAIFIAALPEETIKFSILIGAVERSVDARRRQDVVVLALAVSLGFATMENLFYVALPGQWKTIAAARALTAVPEHGIDGLAMGALLTAARLARSRQRFLLVAALMVPIAFHAAYDFPLFAMKQARAGMAAIWLVVVIVSTVLAIIICNRVLPRAREADRMSGRDLEPSAKAVKLIVTASVLLLVSLLCGISLSTLEDMKLAWTGLILGIVPGLLAIDLFWTAIYQRRVGINAPTGGGP